MDKASNIKEELLFKIEQVNYVLVVELFSLELEHNLEQILIRKTNQISLVESIKIVNNSPSTLTHVVNTNKKFTEFYSVSYGFSQKFMETITKLSEESKSIGNTK